MNNVKIQELELQCDTENFDLPETSSTVVPLKSKNNLKICKKKEAKRKRDSGEAYVSRTTKKMVPAKQVGKPCGCPLNCFEKVGLENVQTIFQNFWELGDHNAQTCCINRRISISDIKRKRISKDKTSRRSKTVNYNVLVEGKSIQVCLKAFLSIHGISEKRLRIAIKKGLESGTDIDDQRGKDEPSNKRREEVKNLIRTHVQKLPTSSSTIEMAYRDYLAYLKNENKEHLKASKDTYSKVFKAKFNLGIRPRKSATRNFCDSKDIKLRSTRNQIKDAIKIKEITLEKNIHIDTSEDTYSKIYKTEFNVGIEPPKSETCNYCDSKDIELESLDQIKDAVRIREIALGKKIHTDTAEAVHEFRKVYEVDSDSSLTAIAIGLQSDLPIPYLTTGLKCARGFQYTRKLSTYNLCIHNLKSKVVYFYIWNETEARKGSSEIASCLLHYVENFVSDNIKKLVIFSDNCRVQYKNINIVLYYLRLIQRERFQFVQHYYTVPGHSFLPCNEDFDILQHSLIDQNIYSTAHYIELIKNCSTHNIFYVIEMKNDSFFDFDCLHKGVARQVFLENVFQNARCLIFSEDYKIGFKIKSQFACENPIRVKLQKGKSNKYEPSKVNLAAISLPLKYPNGIKITAAKLSDLKDLCKLVPQSYQSFYQEIFRKQQTAAILFDENDGD